MGNVRSSVFGLTHENLTEHLHTWDEPSYRVGQILEWLYVHGATSFDGMTTLSKGLRQKLVENLEFELPQVEAFESTDGTTKFRFILRDGLAIESVWIPEEKRNTLCISSQVGCPLACAFCVTGAVGYKRNLTAGEIVGQVWYVKAVRKLPVSNLVFMGMGEPLLNLENVVQAIGVLSEKKGLAVGRRKITVSTAGILPNIPKLLAAVDVKLAISLTGASDESRDYWMPINRKHNLAALMRTLRKVHLPPGRQITFEVVLMNGRNDTPDEAERLAALLKGIPAKVNLIPYNENPYYPDLKRPDPSNTQEFRDILMKRGIHAIVRRNRGEDVMAACGQLAGNLKTKEQGPDGGSS